MVSQRYVEASLIYIPALTTDDFLGEVLASAGDDGNVLLWQPSDTAQSYMGSDDTQDDLEHWKVKTMCRSSNGSEIYDLAWSPDGTYFVTGSMDNVARIYNAEKGRNVELLDVGKV